MGYRIELEDIENQADKIRDVDYRDIKDAASEMISSAPQIVGILYPGENLNAQ